MINTTPYSEGSPKAKVCVVVEAPGRMEWLKQRPLVGPSGKLFDAALHDADIMRSDIQIANVSREMIPSVAALLGRKGLTERGRAAVADLADRLQDSEAKVFVPMGNLALYALTGCTSITKHRGSPLKCTLKGLEGRKVIPAIHPAACLPHRGREHYIYTISADLRKAVRHAEHDLPFGPDRRLIIHPTYAAVRDFLQTCMISPRVAFDIETLNKHVSCISFAYSPMEAISIPFYSDPWSEEEECQIWKWIDELLNDPNIEKVGANICSFDIPFLFYQNKILTRGKLWDIMVMSRIRYPDFPAKLEFLASIFSDEPYYKDDKKLWSSPSRDINTFYRYNAKDSAVALDCLEGPQGIMGDFDEDYTQTLEHVMAPYDACLYMGMRGMRVLEEELKRTQEKIRAELRETEERLKEVSDYEFSPTSSKQVMNYFYVHKNIKAYTARRKKSDGTITYTPTADDKALARIARRYQFPEASLIQQHRNLSKLLSTYLEVARDSDGRLRCIYDIKGTTSSRLSSRETPWGTGMNFQNLDPRFKMFLVPG